MSDSQDDAQESALQRQAVIGSLVGGVVHETRNIMTGILSFSQIGKRRASNAEQAEELFAQIETEALRCLDVFEHVLGQLRGEELVGAEKVAPVDAVSSMHAVRALVRERARANGVMLRVDLPDVLPLVMAVDRYIVQILLNLVINAVQASEAGGTVFVAASVQSEWVSITVSDAGAGVPEEEREKIFDSFYTTKGAEGTGVGLTVSRRLAEDMGGSLTVDDNEGGGARFELRLVAAP